MVDISELRKKAEDCIAELRQFPIEDYDTALNWEAAELLELLLKEINGGY